MAKRIQKVSRGQAPTLLNADKANELINVVNELSSSECSGKAQSAGFMFKSQGQGGLILDITDSLAEGLGEVLDSGDREELYRQGIAM